jgi:hypothetical protein
MGVTRRSPSQQWLLYPLGGVMETARAVHLRFPHAEHRIRRATSGSLASYPPNACMEIRGNCSDRRLILESCNGQFYLLGAAIAV